MKKLIIIGKPYFSETAEWNIEGYKQITETYYFYRIKNLFFAKEMVVDKLCENGRAISRMIKEDTPEKDIFHYLNWLSLSDLNFADVSAVINLLEKKAYETGYNDCLKTHNLNMKKTVCKCPRCRDVHTHESRVNQKCPNCGSFNFEEMPALIKVFHSVECINQWKGNNCFKCLKHAENCDLSNSIDEAENNGGEIDYIVASKIGIPYNRISKKCRHNKTAKNKKTNH